MVPAAVSFSMPMGGSLAPPLSVTGSESCVPCRANVQTPAAHQLSANQTAVTDSRADRAFDWYMLRWRAIECGDYENAARAFREAIRLRPDIATVWRDFGLAHHEMSAPEQGGHFSPMKAQGSSNCDASGMP